MTKCPLPDNPQRPVSIPGNDRAISVRDASNNYGLPQPTLRRYLQHGIVESFRIGRSVFISEQSLKQLLATSRRGGVQ
jgi:hypothetical protein